MIKHKKVDEANVSVYGAHDEQAMDSTSSTIKQEFKTRIAAGDEQHTTIAEFNFDGVTNEQLQALAMRSLVINAQAIYRTAGHVPPQDRIKVADMLARERATGGKPMSVEKLAANIGKMSEADKAKMLALLTA